MYLRIYTKEREREREKERGGDCCCCCCCCSSSHPPPHHHHRHLCFLVLIDLILSFLAALLPDKCFSDCLRNINEKYRFAEQRKQHCSKANKCP